MFGIINWVSSAIGAVGSGINSLISGMGNAADSLIGTAARIAISAVETVGKLVNVSAEVAKAAFAGSVESAGAVATGVGKAVTILVSNPSNVGGALSALATGTGNALSIAGGGLAKAWIATLQGGVQSYVSAMSFLQTSVDSLVSLAVALLTIPFGFNQWQMVELPISSGASCGNGSPYRFFINKTPLTTNAIVYMEGGGACWDYKSCTNQRTDVRLLNKNGEIPRNYMNLPGFIQSVLEGAGGSTNLGGALESPFLARMHPAGKVQTQDWNIVFAPYCTGDTHAGNVVKLYPNPDDETTPKVYYHKGHKNAQLIAAWMKANLPKPDKLLVTGSSAGGYGATANYGTFRDALSPKKSSALLSDSGVFFWSPPVTPANPEGASSLPAYNKVASAYSLNSPGHLFSEYRAKYPSIDPSNFGSIAPGWAKHYPNDRIGLATFSSDTIIPEFMYSELPSFTSAPNKAELAESLFRKEIENTFFGSNFPNWNNIGYYIPNWRSFAGSHTLATVTFGNTGIPELGIKSFTEFVDNLLGNNAVPVMRAHEKNSIKRTLTADPYDYMESVFGAATAGPL